MMLHLILLSQHHKMIFWQDFGVFRVCVLCLFENVVLTADNGWCQTFVFDKRVNTKPVHFVGLENLRPFYKFSTFYGSKYFTSLYNSKLNCPEDNTFLGNFA